MGKPGSIPSSPRRRRGGSRGARRGSMARGGEVQRGWEWDQRVAGVPRGAVEQQEVACGPPRRQVAPLCVAAEEAGSEGGGRRLLDFFVIFEKSRGPTVKQK